MVQRLGVLITKLALMLCIGAQAHAASFAGGGVIISSPVIDGAGDVATTLENITGAPITVDLMYVRAPRGSLLGGIGAGVADWIETQCMGGITIPAGATVGPFAFTPTASGEFCNGFITHVAAVPACSGAELGCRSHSRLVIPAPTALARGSTVVTETIVIGSNAPAGATSVLTNILPGSVPFGYSISVPASIPIPASGTESTFDIDVTFPAAPTADADWIIEYRFNTETDFFGETEVVALGSGVVPTVSQWALATLALLFLIGGTLVIRRRSMPVFT